MGAWTENSSVKVVKVIPNEFDSWLINDNNNNNYNNKKKIIISPGTTIDERNRPRIRIRQRIDRECDADTSTTNKKRTTTATKTTAITQKIIKTVDIILIINTIINTKFVFHFYVLITSLLLFTHNIINEWSILSTFKLKTKAINYLCLCV